MSFGFSVKEIEVRTSDGRNVVTLAPFSYTAKDGTVYTVPASASSDGASTPRELWITLPPFGVYWLAAVFHDWLYRASALPKDRCDSLLLEAMISLGVPPFERGTIYEGVHLGGWSSFEQDRAMEGIAPSMPHPAAPSLPHPGIDAIRQAQALSGVERGAMPSKPGIDSAMPSNA